MTCAGAKAGALQWEVVYRPAEQLGSYASQDHGPQPSLGQGSSFPSSSTHFFVLVSGTKREGAGDSVGLGPKLGLLCLLGMTKPQWKGLCLWPELAWIPDLMGHQGTLLGCPCVPWGL